MAVDDGCDDTGQVAMLLYFVQLTGLDERREHGLILCACIVAREECIFPLECNWADGAFNCVAVHPSIWRCTCALHLAAI